MDIIAKAKLTKPATKIERRVNADTVKLAVAWAQSEVTLTQCAATLKIGGAAIYSTLAVALKMAVMQGKLK